MPILKGENDILYYEPPPGIFRIYAPSEVHQVISETQIIPIFQKVSFPKSGGIFTYYLKNLYPEKGVKVPVPSHAVAIAKRNMLGFLSLPTGSKWIVLPILGFVLMPWKAKIKTIGALLIRIIESTDKILQRFYLHKRFYSVPMRELRTLIYLFLKNLGFSQTICSRLSEILIMFPQFDDQYRYRIQDIFSVSDKKRMLDNPKKELLYLWKTYSQRELGDASKLGSIAKIMNIILWMPKIKKAFIKAVKHTDIDKIKLDEADMYFTLCMGKYNFMGADLITRKKTYFTLHNGQIPPWMELQYK